MLSADKIGMAGARPFGLVIVAILTVALTNPDAQSADSSEIVGRVVDATSGTPLADVWVQAKPETGAPLRAGVGAERTDADGRFRLTSLPGRRLRLSAERAGYLRSEFGRLRATGGSRPLTIASKQVLRDVTVLMWRETSMSGRVSEGGSPAAGVTVRAIPRKSGLDVRPFATGGFETKTDERGEYSFIVPPGEYAVVVPRAIGAPASAARRNSVPVATWHPQAESIERATIVRLNPGDRRGRVDVKVVMRPSIALEGKVFGPTVEQWKIVVTAVPDGVRSPVDERFSTPVAVDVADGVFRIVNLPRGSYTVRANRRPLSATAVARDPDGLWAHATVESSERDVKDVLLTLGPGVSVGGQIVYDRPKPASIGLALFLGDLTGREPGAAMPNVQSGFPKTPIRGVTPGPYLLWPYVRGEQAAGWSVKSAERLGRDLIEGPLDVGKADIADVVITLTNLPSEVSGIVTMSTRLLAEDVTVLAFPADPAGWKLPIGPARRLVRGAVDSLGRYTLRGLPAGDYFLAAVHEVDMDGWPDATFLQDRSRSAARLSVKDGKKHLQHLSVSR